MREKRGHRGEGTVFRRADGRWCGRLNLTDGTRQTVYAKTRAECRSKLTLLKRKRDGGQPTRSSRITLAEFLTDWILVVKPSLRPQTWTQYERNVRLHVNPTIGRHRLTDIDHNHLQTLYSKKLDEGLTATTVRHIHTVIRRALQDAQRWQLVVHNVAVAVAPPGRRRYQITVLNEDESRALLQAARTDPLEALYVLALTTGMRRGELLALRWRDVDVPAATLAVRATIYRADGKFERADPKTSRSRRLVPLTPDARAAMERHRLRQSVVRNFMGERWEHNDLVFCNHFGRPIEGSNLLRRSFQPLLDRAGVPHVRFHDLRHSTATLLLGAGINPKVVADLLGHANIGITLDTYSHVTPGMQRHAADALSAVLFPEDARTNRDAQRPRTHGRPGGDNHPDE